LVSRLGARATFEVHRPIRMLAVKVAVRIYHLRLNPQPKVHPQIFHMTNFENNAPQMRYAEYREKKFFVGSGVVEAGCRTVIGERLKQSGMRWSVRGANAIIALRCCILSGRFEDFWASRTVFHIYGIRGRMGV
jgi:hypothetical protein